MGVPWKTYPEHDLNKLEILRSCWADREREDLLEFDGERQSVEKDVNLEDAEEEKAKVLEHLGEEIPKEANIGGEVGN